METSNAYERIREIYPTLSKGYKKIADYILNNSTTIPYMTAASIAKDAGVSESSVVRFADKCGYDGFPKLKEALFDLVREDKVATPNWTVDNVIANEVMNDDINNIIDTYKNLDLDTFNQAVKMLKSARKVYIIGVRESALVAKHLAYYLNYILDDVILVDSSSSNSIIEGIFKITSKDVLIGISFPNYSYNVLKGMEYANMKSANIISITDNKNSPMIMYSSCNIFALTKLDSIAQSLTAPLSIVNFLVNSLCNEMKSKVIKNLDVVTEALVEYQLEGDDDINMLTDLV